MSLYNDLNSVLTPYANKIKQNEANVRLALSLEGGGAPTVVSSVSAMTNTNQIYVLSTDGQWYYHNGSSWVAGGEYGTVVTDKTLTLEDSPADAKAVGDAVNGVKAKMPEVLDSDAVDVDLDISDIQGNVIARFTDGHIQTKEFDSTFIGDKTALTTTTKTDVVSAINEVKSGVDSKVNLAQGTKNTGKALVVDENGNVAPQDIGVEVDATLTQSGMAADAYAVGERLANLDFDGVPEVATPEEGDADLYICDNYGNVVVKFEDGEIETKNFNSATISEQKPFDVFTATGNFRAGNSLTLMVTHDFKKGDEIYFHLEDGTPYYDYGAYATYYEENRVVMNNRRGSNDYVRHIITQNCSSVKVAIGGTAYSSSREITLCVYLKHYDPIPKIVTVKADGTGMFSTIKSAVESITDANHLTNPYVIEVYEGTYNTLEGYTIEEINSADIGGGYNEISMVGVKLTDGMSLRGIGRCDDIILTAELDNTFSSAVRSNISTLNIQGEGSLENVTIFGKNIRYCVHDDFRAPVNSHHKRIVRHCKFDGESLAYSPYMTTYGAGMSAPRDYLIEDCDFGYTIGIHSNGGYTFGCTIELNNCSGANYNAGDSARDGDAINRIIFNNCNFQRINFEHKNGTSESHMLIEGVGNEHTMVYDPLATPYRLGMIDIAPTGLTVGKMVKRIAGSLSLEATNNKRLAHGIVIGADDDFCYVQKCGYIAANMLNLSGLTVGDYVTVDSTGTVVTGGSESDAVGIVVATNTNTVFIKMLIGGIL